ncbi:MAG: response regulator [Verrucomicrobia bacterium]|nr:response regulator [Verrucomicrobiota bacterium]
MRILVIDDSRTVRRLLVSYLKDLSIDSAEAGDGREALEKVENEGPLEACLVDWDMPVMNGLDFVKAVRAKPELAGMKLMMVTAQTSFNSVAEALAAGADDYLMKPLTRQMLEEKLRLLGLID